MGPFQREKLRTGSNGKIHGESNLRLDYISTGSAGGQQIADLTARYHIVLPKFIWNNGYMNVTANAPRPLAQNEVGRELAQKTFESELRCLYACFTYLGYGTLPQHKVAALAASTLKKDPPA